MTKSENVQAFMEKAAGYGSVLGLSSMQSLMEELDNPQNKLKIIHVAGTNGKGSTSCFIKQCLMEAGFKVGVYTSPAVFYYEERFTINNIPILRDELEDDMLQIKIACEQLSAKGKTHPTLFEIETALAYLYFFEQKCDFVIIEVGMGGATDATNVMDSVICSVFTSIGMDHMQFLGDSLSNIAKIKAGIMKENAHAISIWQEADVENVLQAEAEHKHTKLTICKQRDLIKNGTGTFSYKNFDHLEIGMLGEYQYDNAVLAVETLCLLQRQNIPITREHIYLGLKKAYWPGRMECLSKHTGFFIDGAHNVPAAYRLKDTICSHFTNKSITYIIGVLADKDHDKMLEILLPYGSDIIAVTPNNSRAYHANELAADILALGRDVVVASSFKDALEKAMDKKNDMILAFGSLSYLGELKQAYFDLKKERPNV